MLKLIKRVRFGLEFYEVHHGRTVVWTGWSEAHGKTALTRLQNKLKLRA